MLDLQACDEARLGVPRRPVPVPDVRGGHAEEAAAQAHPDGVGAAAQEFRDVVDGVKHGLVVVGEARVEHLSSHATAVDLRLVVGQAADVEPGTAHPARYVELPAQERRRLLRHGDTHARTPGALAVRGEHNRRMPGGVVELRLPPALLLRVRHSPSGVAEEFVRPSRRRFHPQADQQPRGVDRGAGTVGGTDGEDDARTGTHGLPHLMGHVGGTAAPPTVLLLRSPHCLPAVEVQGEVVVRGGHHGGLEHLAVSWQVQVGPEPSGAHGGVLQARPGGPDPRRAGEVEGRGVVHADPTGAPPLRGQRCLPPSGRAPGRRLALPVPHLDPPGVPSARLQRRSAVGHADAVRGDHLARVPDQRSGPPCPAGPDLYAIRGLPRTTPRGRQLPGKSRVSHVGSEDVLRVLHCRARDAKPAGPVRLGGLRPESRLRRCGRHGREAGNSGTNRSRGGA